jgi:hypothetical protein
MELDRIKTLSSEGLEDLSREARRLIDAGPAARRTHGEIMLCVIGAVVTSRQAKSGAPPKDNSTEV